MKEIIKQLGPGDHAALFYRNRVEQFAAAIPYIQIGLARNERCLYITADNSVPMIVAALETAGVDVATAQVDGRLTITTPEHTYLKHGVFEPEKMVDCLMQEIETAKCQGFSVLRSTGDLGWASALPTALRALYEYEATIDSKFSSAFLALCQYNETLFSPELLGQMLRIHPKVITRGKLVDNPFYLDEHARSVGFTPVTVEHLVSHSGLVA